MVVQGWGAGTGDGVWELLGERIVRFGEVVMPSSCWPG